MVMIDAKTRKAHALPEAVVARLEGLRRREDTS
jgi:hypothetical protein